MEHQHLVGGFNSHYIPIETTIKSHEINIFLWFTTIKPPTRHVQRGHLPVALAAPPSRRSPRTVAPSHPRCRRRSAMAGGPEKLEFHGTLMGFLWCFNGIL